MMILKTPHIATIAYHIMYSYSLIHRCKKQGTRKTSTVALSVLKPVTQMHEYIFFHTNVLIIIYSAPQVAHEQLPTPHIIS